MNKIDYTQLDTFLQCNKKYYNKYIKNIAKVEYDKTSIHLDFGSSIHEGLARYYKGESWDRIKASFDSFQDLEAEKTKTKANGVSLLQRYIDRYNSEDKKWKVLGVEKKDSFTIKGITYIVKIDLIVEENQNIYVVDHKSSQTKKKKTFFDSFDPNTQVSGYCSYVQEKYGQCSGFIPNALFVGFRQRKYKGEEAGFHCNFERTIINRYQQQLEDFRENVIKTLDNIENSKVKGNWTKKEGGCTYCEFKELCISCDDEQIEMSLYEKRDNRSYLKEDSNDKL